MKQSVLLLILLIFTLSTRCVAQLTIINPTDHAVSMAVGFYVEKGLWKGWNTKGWVAVAPRDSVIMFPAGITGDSFYYYGRVADCDQTYEGKYALFVHPTDAFSVANAATAAPLTLNEGVKKAAFVKVSLTPGQRQYRLRLPAVNCTQQGQRNGDWLVYLDRDKEEVLKPEQATYVRRLTYQQGVPTGLVRDYFWPTNTLQWDGKLLSEHPFLPQGTCITYDEAGRKREQALYQSGRITGFPRRWDATGKEVVTVRKYRTVKVLSPQEGYLFSYYNSGKSRTVIPVTLPPHTVSWYYEFTASRSVAQMQAARSQFKLLAELSQLVDRTGMAQLAMNALSAPPGGNICNVYLLPDAKQMQLFEAKQQFSSIQQGSRSNLTSAVVPVVTPSAQSVYLGLYNPDNLYGINYALEVVAVVEETEER